MSTRSFLRHYLEMLAAMAVGMLVLEPVRMVAFGGSGLFDRVEPVALAMATEMSAGMAVWMRYRRHPWSMTLEMCAAMFVPFLVLFVPLWAGALSGDAVMVAGHVLMLPAMAIVLLRHRNRHRPAGEVVGSRPRTGSSRPGR